MNSSGNDTVSPRLSKWSSALTLHELQVMQIIRRSFAKEGISWCFRGWTPAWIRLAPNSLIIFMSLEVSGARPADPDIV